MTASASPEILHSSTIMLDHPGALGAIDEPGYSLALWTRQPIPAISSEIRILSASSLPDVRTRLDPGQTRKALADLVASRGFDAGKAFPHWLSDMSMLADMFIIMARGQTVTARLETMDTVGCPRFHVDQSYLRLVCTYRGPGTEWLEDAQVDRYAQNSGAPNDDIIRFGQPQAMPGFAVGLMKGRRYPGQEQAGLVHRSPLPDPADPARVLFCLEC